MVVALRSDGRRQRINYSFGSGNDADIFELVSNTGQIRVRKPWKLDFETVSSIRLTVMAQAEPSSGSSSGPLLYAYTSVQINLVDTNDNAPKFTQEQYTASVWEGNNRGTYVMQVSIS